MSDWTPISLAEAVDFVKDKKEPSDAEGLPYIGLEHIAKDTGELVGQGTPDDVTSTKGHFRTGDVLYGKLRPYLNKVHLARFEGVSSTDIIILRAKANVLPAFIKYRLLMRDFVTYASERTNGVNLPRVSPTTVSQFALRLPSPDQQEQVVAKIEELFSDIDAGDRSVARVLSTLPAANASLLDAAFSGLLTGEPSDSATGLPSGWRWSVVGDPQLSEVVAGLTKNAAKRKDLPISLPYLRVANVQENELDLDEMKQIRVTEAEARQKALRAGDLLVVEGNGSRDQIGRVAVWDGSIEPCVHQNHIIRVRFNLAMNPRFALYWLMSAKGRSAVVERASTTSGLYTLSKSKVESLPLPVADRETQDRIVDVIDAEVSRLAALGAYASAASQSAAALRQSVLAAAFGGQLI